MNTYFFDFSSDAGFGTPHEAEKQNQKIFHNSNNVCFFDVSYITLLS